MNSEWRCEFCNYPWPAGEGNPNAGKWDRCSICGHDEWVSVVMELPTPVTVEDVARVLGAEQTDRGNEAPRFAGRLLHPKQAKAIAEFLLARFTITERKEQ